MRNVWPFQVSNKFMSMIIKGLLKGQCMNLWRAGAFDEKGSR